jgi:hypothetical protein
MHGPKTGDGVIQPCVARNVVRRCHALDALGHLRGEGTAYASYRVMGSPRPAGP